MQKSKKRVYALLMAALLVFTAFFGNAAAVMPVYAAEGDAQMDEKFLPEALSDEAEMTIASWIINAASKFDEKSESGETGSKSTTGDAFLTFISATGKSGTVAGHNTYGFQATGGWSAAQNATDKDRGAWAIAFDATGYEDLEFTATQRSSNAGARDFKLQYSLDGRDDIVDIEGSTVDTVKNAVSKTYTGFKLPVELAGQKFTLYVRNCSNYTVAGNDALHSNDSAVSGINSISLTGTPMDGTVITPVNPDPGTPDPDNPDPDNPDPDTPDMEKPQTVTVAEWAGASGETLPAEYKDEAGDVKGTLYVSADLEAKAAAANSSGYLVSGGWDGENTVKAWVITIDATGYKDLKFSASQKSSGTGPKNFKLQYSLDGGKTIIDIDNSSVALTSSLKTSYNDFQLPVALDGQEFMLYVTNYDTASVNNGTTASGGTSNIKSISFTGAMPDSQIVPPEEGMQVRTIAAVKSEPDAKDMVKGTFILKDGKNFYLQDATGGMVVSFKDALVNPSPNLGDTLTVTGTYGVVNGLPTLKDAVLNGLDESKEELPYDVKTIADILADDEADGALYATRVRIESAALGATDESGYTTLTQGDASIQIYMLPSLTGIVENDIVTMDAVVSKNENSIQLRVASASDVTLVRHVETCQTVTAFPNSGFLDPGAEVVLSCGTEGATIYYSTDGENYNVYSTPVILTKGMDKIYAYAVKDGWANSKVATFTYVIEEEFTQPDADESISVKVAQWAGNANYEEANIGNGSIPGDMFATNDMLDEEASYTVVVNKNAVQPYTKATSTTTGSTSYYMGATGMGSGTDDYVQLALSSAGYTNMKLSFRMRASNSGPGSFQMQYSTDGVNFRDFTTGTYEYKYSIYNSAGDQIEISGADKITDGIARTSLAPAYYVTFTFDVPARASDAEHLYIRMTPGSENAKGTGTPGSTATLRVDSVVLTGNPVISESICSPVSADPAEGEVPAGTELSLSTKTEGAEIYYSLNNGAFTKYNPDNKPVLTFPANVRAYAAKAGMAQSITMLYQYTQAQVSTVRATPNGGAVAAGTVVKLSCKTDGATIYLAEQITGEDESTSWGEWKALESNELTLSELPVTYKVKATKDGYLDSSELTISYSERENEKYNIYFGQMHSHTSYSDGAGTAEEAYQHATGVDNLDFLSVTDHSNSFDNADDASILDGTVSDEWNEGHQLEEKYTTDEFVGIFGYEMTWSNGLGHMNTFNTNGFQSRTQTEYATYSTALQNYYAALKSVPGSISMFNHPGTTFGDFSDFAYYDETIDGLITLIEVGNGEGAIGSSGYFPSYEYYQRALDKGWHIAPTNNQDNHKGRWGDANTARSVVLADSLTRGNIYDAMRNNRVYATEDNDLSVYYTLDGYEMGTILEDDATGDTVHLKVELSDPTDSSLGTVSVITNGGMVLDKKTVSGNEETVEFDIENKYSYYYIKVVEADGDIAVTAPVWVGQVEEAGINGLTTTTKIPLKGEALDINLELYNKEEADMELTSIEFTVDDTVIKSIELEDGEKITPGNAKTYSFDYTYDKAGSMQVTATVHATLNGVEKIYSSTLSLFYILPELVTKVIIDGTHYNDYVTGNYSDSMSNFTAIAEALNTNNNMDVQIAKDEITSDMLEDCALLIISAPGKKTGMTSHFEPEFIQMVKNYTDNGGALIVCGIADYQDTTEVQTATELNKLLNEIGATTRINSDEAYDTVNAANKDEPYRLYLKNFNADSKYLNGAVAEEKDEEGNITADGQVYSAYSGCTVALDENAVEAGKAEALVSGFAETYSIDCKDANGNSVSGSPTYVEAGKVVALAHETLDSEADVFVAGTVFMSDYEVKAEEDTVKPYLNRTILENILRDVQVALPVTNIKDMRQGEMGEIFTIEGYVTAGTATPGNIFFDTIYIQDDTAGTTVFPYAIAGLEVGTKIQVTGYVDAYQGDKELQVMYTKILEDEPKIFEPEVMSAADAMNYDKSGGKLVKVEGKVVDVLYDASGEGVSQLWLDDGSGEIANVFIDGYILSAKTLTNKLASVVEKGATVSAVGLVYAHPEGESDVPITCLRVRNCDEIVQTASAVHATGISLDKTTAELQIGQTLQLTAKIEPADATDEILWESSNDAIAKVENGVVTGVSAGTATITAKAGSQSASCEVTVIASTSGDPTPPTQGDENITIALDKTSAALAKGKTLTLKATVSPANTAVTWTSSDTGIATVTNGVVKGIKAGTAIITAKAGSKTATCTVKVGTVTLNYKTLTMKKGKSTTGLLASYTNDAYKSWKSSNSKVVKVTVKKGKATLKALKKGTATITITSQSGATATCKVKVQTKDVKTTKLTLNKKKATLKVKKSLVLKAVRLPITATDKVTWTSSNKKVATVSKSGKVTAKKAGTATITMKAGSKKATCKITVKK